MLDLDAKCPKCGSEWITSNKQPVSSVRNSDSLSGSKMIGRQGIALGFRGSGAETILSCRKCGNRWKASK